MSPRDPDATWRFAMRQLQRPAPGAPFEWTAGGLQAVKRRLADRMREPRASEELAGMLRLGSALRRRLGSVAAADALLGVLRETPGAIALARAHYGPKRAEDVRRRFQASTGERALVRAPVVGAAATPGSTPIRALIDPLERERRKARKK